MKMFDFERKKRKGFKINFIFNHLTAKATLLSKPNKHFFQHIFKNVFTRMYKQGDSN